MLPTPTWMSEIKVPAKQKRPVGDEGDDLDSASEKGRASSPKVARKDEPNQTSRTGGQQSTSRARGPRKSENFQDPLERLGVAVAELSLETAGANREIRGYLEHTVLAAQDHALPVGGLEGHQEWEQEKKAKKGQNIGSSCITVGLKSLQAFAQTEEIKEEVNSGLKLALEAFWSEIVMKIDRVDLPEHLCVFRVFKPKVPSKAIQEKMGAYTRMVFRFKPATRLSMQAADLEEQLLLFCRRKGWRVMSGTPPRANRERNVQDCLQAFRI